MILFPGLRVVAQTTELRMRLYCGGVTSWGVFDTHPPGRRAPWGMWLEFLGICLRNSPFHISWGRVSFYFRRLLYHSITSTAVIFLFVFINNTATFFNLLNSKPFSQPLNVVFQMLKVTYLLTQCMLTWTSYGFMLVWTITIFLDNFL